MNLSDLFLCLTACIVSVVKFSYAVEYSDTWAVHIEGGERTARDLAHKHGFVYVAEVSW